LTLKDILDRPAVYTILHAQSKT